MLLRFVGLCLAGVASLLIAAAQTSPADATSNLAAWYELLPALSAPAWLANPSTDEWAVWIGVAGLFIGAVLFISSLKRSPTRPAIEPHAAPPLDLLQDRRHLISSWRNIIGVVEDEHRKKHRLVLDPILRRHSDYYRLEQYLSAETREAVADASAGIRITPALRVGGEETHEERAFRLLRQDIARIEREWELIPPLAVGDDGRDRESTLTAKRQLIRDAYRMLDQVAEQRRSKDGLPVTKLIAETNEYYRIEPYLSKMSRGMMMTTGDVVVWDPSASADNFDEMVLKSLRRDVAALERQWGLA